MVITNRALLAMSVVLVFTLVGVHAQQTMGTISGVVQDETGGVLPGVEVTARNTETETTRTVISDDEGRYRLSQLAPGAYELRVELSGFQTALLQGITLSMAQEAVVGITLSVGEITEQVVVAAEVSLVDTTSATVAALVDNRSIRDLPLNGRDFIQLASLQEGVVTPAYANRGRTGDAGVKLSIGGSRDNGTAVLLDGTDIKNHWGTTPGGLTGALLGVDTVREFRVITNVISAEYGRFTGGVISAVTKSGTNEIHGTVFEFHRNSALDARNFFDRDSLNPAVRSDPPPFKRNQFGFTLGGPIVKDQTFIFGSYEGVRERLTTSFISIFPNEDAHQGILPGQAPIDIPVEVQPYMDLFPLPNGLDNGDGTGQFLFDNPQPTDQDYFVIKLDHEFSDSDSFFVRYTFDDSTRNGLTETYIYGVAGTQRSQYLTIEQKHIFSPNLLNEVRVAYNRSLGNDEDMENIPVPQPLWFRPDRLAMGVLQIRGGLSQFGTTTRTPQFHTQNLFQYMDNLVWTRGVHSMKMGTSVSRFQYNMANQARFNGSFAFRNLSSFMQGDSNQATLYSGEPFIAGHRQWLVGTYFQDDVQFRPNLTLNLGVRYEFITSPTEVGTGEFIGLPEVNGRIGNLATPYQVEPTVGNPYFENPSLKNFSPRLGIAWDPTGSGKNSIRVGFGLFHDQLLPWLYRSSINKMKPFSIEARLEPPLEIIFPTGLRTLTPDSPAILRPGASVVLEPTQPYMMQWSLSLQRQILSEMAVTVTYTGSRGVHLSRSADVNRPLGTVLPDGRRFFDPNTPEGTQRHNPGYAGISGPQWDANSWYNGLKLGLVKRYSSGFQYQVSYHWQKSIDENSAGSLRTTSTGSTDFLDHTLDRGLSNWNTEHTFSTHWGVELPFGPGQRYGAGLSGFMARLVEGWQINGIVQLASGGAVGISGNGDVTCDDFCSSRPDLIPGRDNSPNTGDPNQWFGPSPDNFMNQEPGFFGNLGRNTGVGPGLATFDFSVNKSFTLSETADLQFRTEVFNVFNRTNFFAPRRTRTTFNSRGPVGSFGQILSTSGSSRQIQLALKIIF